MELLRTEKDVFTEQEILDALNEYEEKQVPIYEKWWLYYRAKNTKIEERPPVDANNPDYRTL